MKEAEAEAEALKHGRNGQLGDGVNEKTEADADDRPSTPPDGEEEFTDDDGTTYKWDCGLRAWVPQVCLWTVKLVKINFVELFAIWTFFMFNHS